MNTQDISSIQSSWVDAINQNLRLKITTTDQQTSSNIVVNITTTAEPWAQIVADVLAGQYGPIAPYVVPVPQAVTMRQARLALLQENLLNQVDSAINSLPSPSREQAQIEWEYSTEVLRNSPWVIELTPMLGLTSQQMDDLFKLAITL